jgi:ribose/xylose/arabinose/galactoside ABC-type transport system permease subunit
MVRPPYRVSSIVVVMRVPAFIAVLGFALILFAAALQAEVDAVAAAQGPGAPPEFRIIGDLTLAALDARPSLKAAQR